jgi:hypothetical protein
VAERRRKKKIPQKEERQKQLQPRAFTNGQPETPPKESSYFKLRQKKHKILKKKMRAIYTRKW